MTEIDFTEDKENFKWKGHGPLLPKEGSVSIPAGFKLQTGLQLIPAAPVSALSVETGWGLLAAGTIHGFILYDFMNKKTVTTKWTVSQGRSEIISLDVLLDFLSLILEVSGLFLLLGQSMNYIFSKHVYELNTSAGLSFLETDSGEQLSRKKSLKESIRRSFRRLRSRRGSRGGAERTPSKEGEAPASPAQEAVGSPVSRLVEESRVDESVLSMVRCLYFVDTFVKDGKACLVLKENNSKILFRVDD